ncbi:MAG: malto-oligosyltrehalose synthase [Cellvibrio sp.]
MLRATIRLQFHQGFTLDDAVPLVPYFARLGISHIYASPLLTARRGSMHGYDVVDPTRVNPELGGEAALERLVAALREYKMGLIADFVSNHMAVGGDANPWWLDVLEWGISSPYARFFDIQWNSHDPLLKGQLLVPFLRTDYGEVLAADEINLHFDAEQGAFYTCHYDHRFPVYPPSYGEILRNTGVDSLLALVRPFEALERSPDYWHAAQELRQELARAAQAPEAREGLAQALEKYRVKPDGQFSQEAFDRLHNLLEAQHYRLASWRTAADDINWRRFFDVNELGGLRVEKAEVFEATHAKIFELIERGLVDGLRIDHVDGLANPRAYCRKLRRRLNSLQAKRPPELRHEHLPIYVEKILGDGERLPADWLTDGTTGYEFMNDLSLLQQDPVGEIPLSDLWTSFTGRTANFMEEVREARALVLSSSLAGDFESLAHELLLVARTDVHTRDITLGAIRRALFELIVHFPVYRTYAGVMGRSVQDREVFEQALAGARTTLAESDWPLLNYLDLWLGGQRLRDLPPGPHRKQRRKVITRFQQLTSPAAAKAVEDTACYRSAVTLARNDVGFDPQHFSISLKDFHHRCSERAAHFPDNLLTTATHDHKRGEDTRARLGVLSERAVWFSEKVQQWQQAASDLRQELDDGLAPSPADELMLYQTLLGSWPLRLDPDDTEAMGAYQERMLRWQEKALREAKLRTLWSAPHAAYEDVCRNFLTALLTGERHRELRRDIAAAAMAIAPAGAVNSLSQSLLRSTLPGVPDLYQGAEFWDFSLVDPDNRRPVDFPARVAALSTHSHLQELVTQWRDGRIKQHLLSAVLNLREAHAELFCLGNYEALEVEGEQAGRIVAFCRRHGAEYVIGVAPRLVAGLLGTQTTSLPDPASWGDTRILLPDPLRHAPAGELSGVFSSAIKPRQGALAVAEVLAEFPVNLLYIKHDPAVPHHT